MDNLNKILNKEQLDGVLTTEGPVLILAGAGSGKTRVLTHRVAYLIEEKGVAPWNIMAITFTNKAANEMKERVDNLTGGNNGVWISTFHSACVRILRRFAENIGYKSGFSIYDTEDSKTLMKHILKEKNIDTKQVKEKYFLNQISHLKDELIDPDESEKQYRHGFPDKLVPGIYREYQARLKANNAFDFDDLIVKTVELLGTDEEVRNYYNDRIHYLMVDEYQDTNAAQFELIRLLTDKRRNLCVVGDDDQSIYKFRGADIENILSFEKKFPDAKVIKLEQNYRSYSTILDAANAVISNNKGRKEKHLFSERGEGEKIRFRQFDSGYEEAEFIANDIRKKEKSLKDDFRDFAVLYRTNAQSRILEEKMLMENIPYRIVGGVNFYQRREVKDILAYLQVIENPSNDVSVRRILNVPKRGIGATTEGKVAEYAVQNGLSFFEALDRGAENGMYGRSGKKIIGFVDFIDTLTAKLDVDGVTGLVKDIIEDTGYAAGLKAEGTDEAEARLENIDELINKAAEFERRLELDEENKSLSNRERLTMFLQDVSLVTDADADDSNDNRVTLMTLHSAKGLEFPNVYLAGLEDGLFPSYMSINSDSSDEEIEEERRLMYVGITRAKDTLTLTCARARMVRGETQYSSVSRFVKEIPAELIDGRVPGGSGFSDHNDRPDFLRDYEPVTSFPQHEGYGSVAYGGVTGYSVNQHKSGRKRKAKAAATAADYRKKLDSMVQKGVGGDTKPDYGVGDRVHHLKFGDGTVTEVENMGRDFRVTVDFDTAGTRKLFAGFAKLVKI